MALRLYYGVVISRGQLFSKNKLGYILPTGGIV